MDEAIKGLVGGDVLVSKEGVFIKENGHYRATAPLDIDNQKMENLPEPLEDGDAVNKKYIDGIVEALTLKQGLVRENGGFNLVDSYINMNFNNIRNVGNPQHDGDAVPKSFVDTITNSLKESTDKKILDTMTILGKMLARGLKRRTHIISASASYRGDLVKGDYQFTWSGQSMSSSRTQNMFNGFLIPADGYIKKISAFDTGMKFYFAKEDNFKNYVDKIGINNTIPLFSLILIREKELPLEIGKFSFMFTDYKNKDYFFKYKDSFDNNFFVKQQDIINIRTEFDTFFYRKP